MAVIFFVQEGVTVHLDNIHATPIEVTTNLSGQNFVMEDHIPAPLAISIAPLTSDDNVSIRFTGLDNNVSLSLGSRQLDGSWLISSPEDIANLSTLTLTSVQEYGVDIPNVIVEIVRIDDAGQVYTGTADPFYIHLTQNQLNDNIHEYDDFVGSNG